MLKYIKRQTSRRRSSHDTEANASSNNDDDVVDCATASSAAAAAALKRHSLRSTTSFCDEMFMEEEMEAAAAGTADAVSLGNNSLLSVVGAAADEDIFKYSSRLSMTLSAIVSEPDCLSYFVQYLEMQNALPLIKFYLDIENFKRAALTQLQQERPNELPHSGIAGEDEEQEDEEEQEPVVAASIEDEENDVPELKTLCDLSMRKPLTDDEKSRIYAETNKQINNKPTIGRPKACNNNNSKSELRSICAVSINDAIAIYQKYLIVHAPQMVELPIVILAHISLLLCGKDKDKQHIPASCFDEAREYVLQQLERDQLQSFLQSSYYSKYCVELIEGSASSLNIYDVLYDELALFYLTEYLEQQQERECLEFWITAINFRKSYDDQRAAQSDAMIIYERYFSLQSECRLWMSQKLRLRVEQAICAPGQLAQAFDLALLVTAKYLERKHFANFLKSNIFDNYINELKAKTWCHLTPTDSTDGSSNLQHKLSLRRVVPKLSGQQQRHRKTMSMSDCTHISQHNTLLAGLDTVHKQAKTTTTTTATKTANMNIDARQLTNPQLLWQRPVSALKFGHVNSLGRYERDFDSMDAVSTHKTPAWSLSVKNAMRKLVNLPEDNVQEEIAWQVAEMIVKDVTSVTLQRKN